MRHIGLLALSLTVAACSTTPRPAPGQVGPTPPVQAQPQLRTGLNGLTANELIARFGQPVFQVREGPGLKLQWSVPACVLDAFLYPPAGIVGAGRVTYVETRRPTGEATLQAGCIAAIDAAG